MIAEPGNSKLSTPKLVGGLLLFFLIGTCAIVWNAISVFNLFNAIKSQQDWVVFDKGSYYLFGAGLACLALAIGPTFAYIFKNMSVKIAKIYAKVFAVTLIGSIVLVFLLPQAADNYVDGLLTQKGYRVCESKTRQWLFDKKVFYTKKQTCE